MDDQTAEKMAKLAADNLRLRDEVKLLNRRLTRAVPLGAPVSDPNQAPVAFARIADLEAIAEEHLGELEALQKCYDQMREEWDAERELTVRLHAEVDALRAGRPTPKGRLGEIEQRLQALEAHCFPNPGPFTPPPKYEGTDPERQLPPAMTDAQWEAQRVEAEARNKRTLEGLRGTYADQAPGPPDPHPGVHHDGQGGQGGS